MSDIITARDAFTVAAEIKVIVQQTRFVMTTAAVEIGRRLVEAKELVPHGEWGEWLQRELDFSKSRANDLMRLYNEIGQDQEKMFGGNLQTFGNLPYTKVLKLLAIPEEEREAFAEENHVADMSTRELDAAVREYKEKLEQAETEKASLQGQLDAAKETIAGQNKLQLTRVGELDKARKAKEDAEAEAARLRREIEVEKIKTKEAIRQAEAAQRRAQEAEKEAAEATVSEDVMAQLRAEAQEQAAKEEAQKAGQAAAEARAAEAKVQELEAKLEAAQKAAKIAVPELTEFNLLLQKIQESFKRMIEIRKAMDGETQAKLTKALAALTAWQDQEAMK